MIDARSFGKKTEFQIQSFIAEAACQDSIRGVSKTRESKINRPQANRLMPKKSLVQESYTFCSHEK